MFAISSRSHATVLSATSPASSGVVQYGAAVRLCRQPRASAARYVFKTRSLPAAFV